VAALGPTFPGRLLDVPTVSSDKACYLTSYDGGCFMHTIPATYAKSMRMDVGGSGEARAHIDLPPQFEDGTYPELARMYLFSSSVNLEELARAIPTTRATLSAFSAGSATLGSAYEDCLPVSVIVLLRPPIALLEDHQPSDNSPVSSGSTGSDSAGPRRSAKFAHASHTHPDLDTYSSLLSPTSSVSPVLIVNLDGPEGEIAVLRIGSSSVQDVISALGDPSSASAMPAVAPTAPEGASVPPSYVYEYRSKGMELHFHEVTHELFRVVLHSNLTNTPDFGRFDRCAYRIYNTYPSSGLPSKNTEESGSGTDGVFSTDALRSSAFSRYPVTGGATAMATEGNKYGGIQTPTMFVGRVDVTSRAASAIDATTIAKARSDVPSAHSPDWSMNGSNDSAGADGTLRAEPVDVPAVEATTFPPDSSPTLNRSIPDNGGLFIDSLSTVAHAYSVLADHWSYATTASSMGVNAGSTNSSSGSSATTSRNDGVTKPQTVQLRAPPGCPLSPTYVGAVVEARILLEVSRSEHLASVSII
jgi:hypothetical protein